jgi:hypothetical protein
MNDIDFSRCRLIPYEHQKVGVREIVSKPAFFLADEMGAGKTKQTIDAAQVLFHDNVIDSMIVICPASVRNVWFDPELGELSKHLWDSTSAVITEYHARSRSWTWPVGKPLATRRLQVTITNYDFIRSKNRLLGLLNQTNKRTLLVLDESSAVKNHKAEQTKACLQLRRKAGRVVLLNGTPIENSPLDMFSQSNIMNPAILGCQNFYHFRARYAIMGGWEHRQIVGWNNLEDMQQRLAPFVLRRLKEDCLDLPEKLPPVSLSVPLSAESWKLYRQMRDDMVAWLDDTTVVTAQQAIVKALRLSQITSGFLGGVEQMSYDEAPERPDWLELPFEPMIKTPELSVRNLEVAQEVGREKLDLLLEWVKDRLVDDPGFKVLVWCRFRPELERILREVKRAIPRMLMAAVYGGQKREDREFALRVLDPRTAPKDPVLVAGTLGTGAKGLNMTAAHTVVNMSFSYSLGVYLQSMDRVHRPGQIHPVSYFDIEATGPAGQKTIDHHIIKARRTKENMATWTTSAWKRALTEE